MHLKSTESCRRAPKTEITTMIHIDLSGKVILLTGAMGAIAEHMVKRLNAAGAMLILIDLKPAEQARRTLRDWQIPAESYLYYSTDVTDSVSLTRAVDESFERFPGMDTVLGHAGGCGLHPFGTTLEADFERIFRFNFFAQTFLTRAVFAQWVRRKIPGHLIFTSSYVALVPPHPDSLLCLRQSRARKLCPVHGSGVCIHGRPRECSFARECCGGKFALGF